MVIQIKQYYTTSRQVFLGIIGLVMLWLVATAGYAQEPEWIQACVWDQSLPENQFRTQIATCLGWQTSATPSFCQGAYSPLPVSPLEDPDVTELKADQVVFNPDGKSVLKGHVQVQQNMSVMTARTAQVYRSAKTHQIERIELNSNVHFIEPSRLMIAKHATLHPQDKTGYLQKVLYRFDTERKHAVLPAWGTAEWVRRFANENYDLHKVTYTTCSPHDRAWKLQARDIHLDHAKKTGVARDAVLKVHKVPVFYFPYINFPTSSERKSGFLMPSAGYTNVNGFDFAAPYYLNLAPNYDATITPHYYTLRGLMLGGAGRFLTQRSTGVIGGSILPQDSAFKSFIAQNVAEFPSLRGTSTDRWSVLVRENTRILPNLNLNIDFQQVSDDYYLQNFSTNLAISSENQLLRQGSLVYTSDHWLIGSSLQSYQTLHPVNQSAVGDIYERFPQVLANGTYHDLPLNTDLNILGQFDYFRWPGRDLSIPQGSRYHFNPILSMPRMRPWGYITPNVELVENNYGLSSNTNPNGLGASQSHSYNRMLPRAYIDSGLTFERDNAHFFTHAVRQTLEPRLYYLYVPYQNQSEFPSFDSAYMIFNTDQLFRTNRFSGFDRISDANQLAYAVTTRWLSPNTGQEKAQFTIGQLRYFAQRRVQLCFNPTGQCRDSTEFLGYVSPTEQWSPIATNAVYNLNSAWSASAGYVWDPATKTTNNSNLNLHYQPSPERMLNLNYNYLTSGNLIAVPSATVPVVNNALDQVTLSYAWPFTENWSSLGVYSYNLSAEYTMLAFLGVQYDTCCWAVRLLGGQTFQSLMPNAITPQYNNNVYLQFLFKGLGSVANSNPATTIQSYFPGYRDMFKK